MILLKEDKEMTHKTQAERDIEMLFTAIVTGVVAALVLGAAIVIWRNLP